MLVPVVTAAIALVAALAGYVMVKFYGVIFLGAPREEKLAKARDASLGERLGMLWLLAACVALGLAPNYFVGLMDGVTRLVLGEGLGPAAARHDWWLLAPISVERASYGPVVFFLGILLIGFLVSGLVRRVFRAGIRRSPPWDCGYPLQTARMQDTAEGFGQPIRQIFEPFFRMQRHLPSSFDEKPVYRVVVEDHFWYWIYLPIARIVERIAREVGRLQQGRIAIYLLYSFLTLIGMLIVVM
jgi:hypothetical protein